MKKISFVLLASCYLQLLPAQDTVTHNRPLGEVVVEAFNSRVHWKEAPAAVAVIGKKEIDRYSGTSLVPVLNTVPGVRMEERSPASYRLSFRGSLLRSPFGVRNIKVYWNNIPLTDAGGNTYINLVDVSQVTGAELIKGPAASVYGAGTGGVLLLQSGIPFSASRETNVQAGITGGSFGLFSQQAGWQYASKHFTTSLQQLHQQSDGYRQQSGTRKDAFKTEGRWQHNNYQLQYLVFYTDLAYETPGGLTLAQLQTDPKLARPAAGAIPGAIQQNTAIYNKTIFAGLSQEWQASDHFRLQSFVMANHTAFRNPFITNYEKRDEDNAGLGLSLVYTNRIVQWQNGGEWLYNQSAIDNYANNSGEPGGVLYKDNVYANQWSLYSQLQLTPGKWNITAGVSVNNQSYRYNRLTDPSSRYQTKSISAELTPRLAVLYRLTNEVSLYALAARGFSPPSLAEFRPSDGQFHGNLDAEYGWNYEAGIKGELLNRRLRFDADWYHFRLQNAIVRRTDSTGAEFFVNSGGARQQGMELLLQYELFKSETAGLRSVNLWSGYSFQPYRFISYRQGASDYSGNALTGVPKHNWVCGIDIVLASGLFMNVSYNYTSRIPLTDANDAYADAYHLLQAKAGIRLARWQLFAGLDNILNEVYSLGNDINAAGRRFYNPAGGRGVVGGVRWQLNN